MVYYPGEAGVAGSTEAAWRGLWLKPVGKVFSGVRRLGYAIREIAELQESKVGEKTHVVTKAVTGSATPASCNRITLQYCSRWDDRRPAARLW
jgi:hypothetical protein